MTRRPPPKGKKARLAGKVGRSAGAHGSHTTSEGKGPLPLAVGPLPSRLHHGPPAASTPPPALVPARPQPIYPLLQLGARRRHPGRRRLACLSWLLRVSRPLLGRHQVNSSENVEPGGSQL